MGKMGVGGDSQQTILFSPGLQGQIVIPQNLGRAHLQNCQGTIVMALDTLGPQCIGAEFISAIFPQFLKFSAVTTIFRVNLRWQCH